MRRYLARQFIQLVVVVFGISLLAFGILHVLGDPVLLLLPQNAGKAEFERYRHLLGLDRPLYVQYGKFLAGAVRGDFGKSWYADTPAFTLVLERMPPTIYLTLAGFLVALLISLPLGILAALKRHSWVDTLCTGLAVAGQATPLFWLGIMLIIVFAVRLKLLPASGYGTWQNFLLPAFCLGATLAPITMRLVRSGVIEVMNMEFIKTARAKGLAEPAVVIKHAFRNACIPVITVLGLQFGQLLGGAIITETVFAWPGVATLTVESIRNQDFPVVQCAVVLLALLIVGVNLVVDLVVGFIDPRIRTACCREEHADADRAHRGRRGRRRPGHGAPGDVAPPGAAALGRGRRRRAPAHHRHRDLRAVDRAVRSADGRHPASAVAAGVDGARHCRAPARHRPGRARLAGAHDLRRARLAGGGGRLRDHLRHDRGAVRSRRGLLWRQYRLDDHDRHQRDADLSVRAPGAGGHRGARAEPAQHDLRARCGRVADLRARRARRDPGHPRARVRAGRPRARHEPSAPHLPPDPAKSRVDHRGDRDLASGPGDHPGVVL